MALTITTTLTSPQGFEMTDAYVRVTAQDEAAGTTVTALMNIYPNEQAFLDGKDPVLFPNLAYAALPYNRETDGVDVLNFAHEGLIAELAKLGISATKSL